MCVCVCVCVCVGVWVCVCGCVYVCVGVVCVCECVCLSVCCVLFISVLIRRKKAQCGSYLPGNSTGVSCFSLCCWFDFFLKMCDEKFNGCYSSVEKD